MPSVLALRLSTACPPALPWPTLLADACRATRWRSSSSPATVCGAMSCSSSWTEAERAPSCHARTHALQGGAGCDAAKAAANTWLHLQSTSTPGRWRDSMLACMPRGPRPVLRACLDISEAGAIASMLRGGRHQRHACMSALLPRRCQPGRDVTGAASDEQRALPAQVLAARQGPPGPRRLATSRTCP